MTEHTHRTPTWYREAIFYGVDVARFRDDDGNGFGDFRGLTARLGYLAWLGIDVIWLQPFYKSPRRDNGYDVIDHDEIDPRIGTHGDFVALLREAERRGIRIVIELVINHTSNEHRRIQSSRERPDSPQRDWYVWADDRDDVPDYPSIFPPQQTTTRTWDDARGAFYLHHFHEFEPDLNTGHPDLREETRNMIEYWIRLGVRGFRVDGAPFLGQKRRAEGHRPRALARDPCLGGRDRGRDDPDPGSRPAAEGARPLRWQRRRPMLFNVIGCELIFLALATERAEPIQRAIDLPPSGAPGFAWLNFLRHHDELSLERLSADEQRQVLDAFAPEPGMQIYDRGTRRRLAPLLGGDRRRIKLAFSLLFALPGTPLILAGDEIGMGENLDLPERDAARRPIQWSAGEPNGGFSDATPDDLITPVLRDGPFGFPQVNVADQRTDTGSLLHWIRALIAVRKRANAWIVVAGPQVHLPSSSIVVLTYPGSDGRSLVVAHNLAGTPARLAFDIGAHDVTPVFAVKSRIERDGTSLELPPYGSIWWEQHGVPQLSLARATTERVPAHVKGDSA